MSVFDLIRDSAARWGVPLDVALAVARQESGFRQAAMGAAGEVGVFQLMPGTARDLGVNPFNAAENIDGGIRYLRQMLERFGNWPDALAAYNAGPGRVERGQIPAQTRGYVASILAALGWGETAPAAAAGEGRALQPARGPAPGPPAGPDLDWLLVALGVAGASLLALAVVR